MRLTVVGCSGSLRRARTRRRPATCVEAERRRPHLADRCSTSAAARSVRCSGTSTRRRRRRAAQPPAPRPLRRPVRAATSRRKYHPAGPQPGRSRSTARRARPSGWRRAYDLARARRHERPSSTSTTSTTGRPSRSGRSRSPRTGSTTRSRPTACGSRPTAPSWPTPATPTPATALDAAAAAAPTWSLADSAFVDGRDDAAGIHLSGRAGRRGGRARPGECGGWCSPTCRPGTTREVCRAQAAAVWPGEVELAAPGAVVRAVGPATGAGAPAPPSLAAMTRPDRRRRPQPDQLRDVTHHPRLARPRRGLRPRRVRPDPGAVRGVASPQGVPRWRKGSGAGLGDRRVRDAAARDQHPLRPRVGQGPDRRPHPRDLPADRAQRCAPSSTTKALGENTIVLDCDVLQADGGTRTAAITGAYVALADAVATAAAEGRRRRRQPLTGSVAAVSVGHRRRRADARPGLRRGRHAPRPT